MSFQKIGAAFAGAGFAVLGAVWMVCAVSGSAAAQGRPRTGEDIAISNEKNYHYKGEIAGRVLLDNGKPAVGFTVRAQFVEGHSMSPGEGEAITDVNGKYRIHGLNLPNFHSEAFSVQVEGGRKPYIPDAPRRIFLSEFPNEKAANVNFTVRLGPQITVRVRDAETNAPLSGVIVKAQPFNSWQGGQVVVGETDAKGEVRLRTNYLNVKIEIDAASLHGMKVVSTPNRTFDTVFQLSKIADVVWEVKVYRPDPPYAPATLQGIVTGAGGRPLQGATVHLFRNMGNLQAVTDSAGQFSFQITRFERYDKRYMLLQADKESLHTTVLCPAEQTWGNIRISLPAVPQTAVTGQVTDPQGIPLSGVPVQCSETFLDPLSYSYAGSTRRNGVLTNKTGNFTITGLSPDAYHQITFGGNSPFGYGSAWGETKFPEVNYTFGQMRLKQGQLRDIGRIVVYPADSVVSGHIASTKSGLNITKLSIVVTGKHTNTTVHADVAGNFRANNLVREPLTIGVYSEGGHTRPGSQDDLYQGVVTAGDTNVKIVLR